MTYSFDIFDTCLFRVCGSQENLFKILAFCIVGCNSHTKVMDFVQLRERAEKTARQRALSEEITLDDIYNYCDFSDITEFDNNFIKNKELELHSQLLVVNNYIKKRIDKIHGNGNEVLFISDMYLPESVIKKALIDNGLWKEGDSLFVSSSIGRQKRTGNLYRYVYETLKLKSYKGWVHTGDNIEADVFIPRKLGIKSKKYEGQYTYFERTISQYDNDPNINPLEIVSSISKAIRCSVENSKFTLFSVDFVAPLVVSYVLWILRDAVDRGIKKLFFVARDGFIFYEVAKYICQSEGFNIECKYIYASRKSLYLPGLTDLRIESIAELLYPMGNKSLDEILDRLHIYDLYERLSSDCKEKQGFPLLKEIMSEDYVITILKERINNEREIVFKYLKQEGVNQGSCAIVDLRGSRRCQLCINNILKIYNQPEVYGYYYETEQSRFIDNNYSSLFFYETKNSSINYKLNYYGTSNILEHYYVVTDQKHTAGYKEVNDIIEPVFDDELVDDKMRLILNENLMLSKLFAKYVLLCRIQNYSKEINWASTRLLNDFTNEPKKEYLSAFNGLIVSDSQYKSKYEIKKVWDFKLSDVSWVEGSIVFTFGNFSNYFIHMTHSIYRLAKYSIKRFMRL